MRNGVLTSRKAEKRKAENTTARRQILSNPTNYQASEQSISIF